MEIIRITGKTLKIRPLWEHKKNVNCRQHWALGETLYI